MIAEENLLDEIDDALFTEEVPRSDRGAFRSKASILRGKGYTAEEAEQLAQEKVDTRYGGKPTQDDLDKQQERYERLLKLGASETHARTGSRDVGAFNATRIYLRAR